MSSPNNEFACPSGCMGPETCVNMSRIQDLRDESRTSTPTADQFERILCGELTEEQARQEADEATKLALLGSCAVFLDSQQRKY